MEKQVSQKNEKVPEVIVGGWLKDTFKESHKVSPNTVIFENTIRTVDTWGNVKIEIPIQVDGRLLRKANHNFVAGNFVEIHGELRTKNVYDDKGSKIQRKCYIFIKRIEVLDELIGLATNCVCISGVLARKGKVHPCKNGDYMFDFTLDIRRSRGRRSSVPCVIWGKERSQQLEKVSKGANLEVEGWLKSRTVTDSAGITKNVVEIIVDDFYERE